MKYRINFKHEFFSIQNIGNDIYRKDTRRILEVSYLPELTVNSLLRPIYQKLLVLFHRPLQYHYRKAHLPEACCHVYYYIPFCVCGLV